MVDWKFWRWEKLPPITPPPPVTMTREAFAEAQRRYIDKHDKIVKPAQLIAVEFAKSAVDFGKTMMTFLVAGNVGGLVALVTLHPMMRDQNQVWLSQQLEPALGFAAGLFIAVAGGAFGYLSIVFGVHVRWNIAHHSEVSISQAEYGTDMQWAHDAMKRHFVLWRRADVLSTWTGWVAFGLIIASGACWTYGAFRLTKSILSSLPPT